MFALIQATILEVNKMFGACELVSHRTENGQWRAALEMRVRRHVVVLETRKAQYVMQGYGPSLEQAMRDLHRLCAYRE